MEKRKIEITGNEALANPDSKPDQAQPKIELPSVESPSISPATSEAAAEPATAELHPATQAEKIVHIAADVVPAQSFLSRFTLRPRHKRHALLVASVALAAALGAVFGAATSGGFSRSTTNDVAVGENKATQQSVALLTREITALKASLETANKSAYSQIAKISERLTRDGAGITGSITPPQTIPSAAQATPPQQQAAPLPVPRPAFTAEASLPARLSIVADWSIRETRDGYVYVQGHGDVYQVVPGAPLPGLGPVEQIKRQDGRWLVVTPKGIIVSMRDRRYFEQF
jgi:hypothetical protein